MRSPQSDLDLVSKLMPMLEGVIFYKKFSSQNHFSSKAKSFDPLQAERFPPEQCGYGIRYF